MRAYLLFSVSLFLLFVPVRPITAQKSDRCARVLEQAKEGNPAAQFEVGLCYAWGEGVRQDYDEAARWARKAAKQGNAKAQLALGPLYGEHYGVAADYAEAFKLYARALDRDDVSLNDGPAQAYRRFVRWYRDAADHGDADAQRALGILYANGVGVVRDYEEGYFWLSLSVKSSGGNPERDGNSWARDRRSEIAVRLSQRQIDAVRKRVENWKPAAAR